MSDEIEVKLFYSGKRESNILKQYEEGFNYLHEVNMNIQIIDVDKNPEEAEYFKIIATPALWIKTSGQNQKFFGLAEGLKQLLVNELQGKITLNMLEFKDGRLLAKNLQVEKSNRDEVEKLLQEKMESKGIYKFELEIYRPDEAYAEVSLISDKTIEEYGKIKKPDCLRITAFLSGIFTELFDKEVAGDEVHCKMQGNEKCLFRIMEKKESEEKTRERIRKMFK